MKSILRFLNSIKHPNGWMFVLVVFSSAMLCPIQAQQYYTAEQTYGVKLGTTKPLYDTPAILPTDEAKLKDRKANKPKVIPNFGGRRQLISHNPQALPQGMDPLFDAEGHRMPTNDILPVVNIEGIGEASSGATPPDVNGDAGRDYYVEIVNSTYFRVYDKSGTPVSGLITANSIWSQVQQTSAGDPVLLYDQAVDRWLLTEFPSNNRVLVAISHTSDPRGSWDAYAFQTPRFPDFPKYGIWGDAYYLTTNESGNSMPVYAINRDDILAGVETVRIQRLTVPKIGGVGFEVGQPVDWDGIAPPPAGSPGIIVKLNDDDWGTTSSDQIVVNKIYIDWANVNNSHVDVTSLPTTPYDTDGCQLENTGGFSCIPQPNGQGIDGAEWIICNKANYRNFGTYESFVMAYMVDVNGQDVAGIRWMEMRKTSTEDWHIYQEGTVGSDDGIHRFMPSIAIDGQGNIGLGYAVSGFDKFPSLRYTGRYLNDPPGTMSFTEYEFISGGGSQGFDRFGDYFAMSVDPADDGTFWFSGQYLPNSSNWGTRIVAFRASRDTLDVLPLTLLSPANDAMVGPQQVSFKVFNRGLKTVYDFPLGYNFNQQGWVTEAAGIDSLETDDQFDYTFTTPVDIVAPGNYPIQIATFLDNDGNNKNDTLSFVITKYGHRDIALEYLVEGESNVVCSNESLFSLRVANNGLDTIRHIAFVLSTLDTPIDTIIWTGALAFGEETSVPFIAPVGEGVNTFKMDIDSLNYLLGDEVPANNQPVWEVTAHPDGQNVFLNFKTDNFPQESTWKLFDANNVVIATGGPFTEQQFVYTSQFCLDPEMCYKFTVFDAFGDGMSAQGVQGDYEIFNEDGELIAELAKPNFGAQSSSNFCLTDSCLFDLQVGVAHESSPGAGDAIAIAETSNSLGTVQYSINGGTTFQATGTFNQLSAGEYQMIAKDGAGCQDTFAFSVLACTLQSSITTVPAIGGDVGQIHVAVTGAIGPVTYSIQDGSFVSDSFFLMLEPGNYLVTVKDSVGCETMDSVTVSTSVSTKTLHDDRFIHIYPNPGKGVYQVDLICDEAAVFLPYTMYSATGNALFNATLVRYNDQYKGEVSLVAYPSGVYYIGFRIGGDLIVRRVIKVD